MVNLIRDILITFIFVLISLVMLIILINVIYPGLQITAQSIVIGDFLSLIASILLVIATAILAYSTNKSAQSAAETAINMKNVAEAQILLKFMDDWSSPNMNKNLSILGSFKGKKINMSKDCLNHDLRKYKTHEEK